MQGFVCEEADVAAIGAGAYVIVTLDGGKGSLSFARDGQSSKRPQSGYWSHLDLQLLETTATVGSVSVRLFWDAAGSDPASAEVAAVSLAPDLAGTGLRLTSVALRVYPTSPASNQATKKLYLGLKVDSGAATLKKARLHWRDW